MIIYREQYVRISKNIWKYIGSIGVHVWEYKYIGIYRNIYIYI